MLLSRSPVLPAAPCTVDGCTHPAGSRHLCAAHRERMDDLGRRVLAAHLVGATPVVLMVDGDKKPGWGALLLLGALTLFVGVQFARFLLS